MAVITREIAFVLEADDVVNVFSADDIVGHYDVSDVCEQFSDEDLLGCIADDSITGHLRDREYVVFDDNKQFIAAAIAFIRTDTSALETVLRTVPTALLTSVLENMEGTV